jgi:hypothetical protein
LTSPPVGLVVDVHPDIHRSAVVGEDLAVKQHWTSQRVPPLEKQLRRR